MNAFAKSFAKTLAAVVGTYTAHSMNERQSTAAGEYADLLGQRMRALRRPMGM